jgi:hypothetical protein
MWIVEESLTEDRKSLAASLQAAQRSSLPSLYLSTRMELFGGRRGDSGGQSDAGNKQSQIKSHADHPAYGAEGSPARCDECDFNRVRP